MARQAKQIPKAEEPRPVCPECEQVLRPHLVVHYKGDLEQMDSMYCCSDCLLDALARAMEDDEGQGRS